MYKESLLSNGKVAGSYTMKVRSFPSFALIADKLEEATLVIKNTFRSILENISLLNNVCFELQFVTRPVNNQLFSSKLDIFIVLRAIGERGEKLRSFLERSFASVTVILANYSLILDDAESTSLSTIEGLSASAILYRDSNFVFVGSDSILKYDEIQDSDYELDTIINCLINIPSESVVSFQLIPTQYTNEESRYIQIVSSSLANNALSSVNTVQTSQKDPVIDELSKFYNKTLSVSQDAKYFSVIQIFSNQRYLNVIGDSLKAQINKNADGKFCNLSLFDTSARTKTILENDIIYPWNNMEYMLTAAGFYSGNDLIQFYARLPFIFTARELSNFVRLPLTSQRVSSGIDISEITSKNAVFSGNTIGDSDISVGKISRRNNSEIGFSLRDLTKHMLVVGTPGSGKTTFLVSLLDRLWKEFKLPFLVIEPAKNEYRALIDSIPEIQVFTPGKDFVSPFLINPFIPPKNVTLQSYKTVLKTAFSAAVSMASPLDKIFEESINRVYSEHEWLDQYTSADGGKVFNVSDFIKAFRDTFEQLGYVGDAKNIGTAGLVRLQSIARLFDNYNTIPIHDLLSKPTIIELSALENETDKSLIIALVLLNIMTFINANSEGTGIMKNVLLLEEAHVLLDAASFSGEGEANPNLIAKALLKRMLAEMRSLGLGIIVADQSPEKVTKDIVKLTNIKIAFNLVERDDREIFADSTNMGQEETAYLTRLTPGSCFFYKNGIDYPELVKIDDYRAKHNIRVTISDQEIAKRSTYLPRNTALFIPYPECNYSKDCEKACDFKCRSIARDYSSRLYREFFNQSSSDIDLLWSVLESVKSNNHKVNFCVRMHLLRKVLTESSFVLDSKVFNLLREMT